LIANQSITDLNIVLNNVDIPQGFSLEQNMTAAPSCIITNGVSTLAKALQSSNVSAAAKKNAGLSIGLVDVDVAKTANYNELTQTLEQSIKSKCDVSDFQSMHNVTMLVSNSHLGSLIIDQNMNQKAKCAIDSVVNANVETQQTATTTSNAGGAKTDWKTLLIIGGVIIVALIILGVGFAVYTNMQKKKKAGASATDKVGTTVPSVGGATSKFAPRNTLSNMISSNLPESGMVPNFSHSMM
jgi:hypothetical protein